MNDVAEELAPLFGICMYNYRFLEYLVVRYQTLPFSNRTRCTKLLFLKCNSTYQYEVLCVVAHETVVWIYDRNMSICRAFLQCAPVWKVNKYLSFREQNGLLSIAKNIHVLDQLMVGRKCLQTLLTLVRLDISTRVGATRPSPARHLTHASPGTWSSHATMVSSWGCGRGTSKMHCRGFGHQVLKNVNKFLQIYLFSEYWIVDLKKVEKTSFFLLLNKCRCTEGLWQYDMNSNPKNLLTRCAMIIMVSSI